jgi:hypothetical protein
MSSLEKLRVLMRQDTENAEKVMGYWFAPRDSSYVTTHSPPASREAEFFYDTKVVDLPISRIYIPPASLQQAKADLA